MANFNQQDPIARINRAFDRERSRLVSESVREWTLAAGENVNREGSCVVLVGSGTVATVKECIGTNADRFLGITMNDAVAFPYRALIETVVVPLSGSTASLSHGGLLASNYLLTNASGTPLTEGGGSDYTINATTGVITFTAGYLAANPGAVITVQYSYAVTAIEREFIGGTSQINLAAGAKFGICETGSMGEAYTMVYDTSKQYTMGGQLYTASGGRFTSDATSTIKAGRVIKVPLAGDAYLGIEFGAAWL